MAKQESKEEILRQLIIQAGTESTGKEFTARIMQAIQAEETAHATVKNIVGSHLLATTSPDFEARVLAKIRATKSLKPIIPTVVWYGFAALVALCILVGLQSTAKSMPLLTNLFNLIPLPGTSTQDILEILAFALIGFSGLAILDYLLRQKYITRLKTQRL